MAASIPPTTSTSEHVCDGNCKPDALIGVDIKLIGQGAADPGCKLLPVEPEFGIALSVHAPGKWIQMVGQGNTKAFLYRCIDCTRYWLVDERSHLLVKQMARGLSERSPENYAFVLSPGHANANKP